MGKKYEDMTPEEQHEADLEKARKNGEQFKADLEKANKYSHQAIIFTLVAIAINIFNMIRILIEAYQQVR